MARTKEQRNLVPVRGRLSGLPAGTLFQPRSNLTYQVISDLVLDGASAHRSLFTGAVLRRCTFRRVDFSRCDFDGIRIEQCTFEDCSLENVDLRSAVLGHVSFQRTSFEGSYQTHCRFENCTFEDCSMESLVLTESVFRGASFVGCRFSRSSIVRNEFREGSFDHVMLGDCTFLYCIMKGCEFRDTTLNAESLGMVYGITSADLHTLRFIYLGEEQFGPAQGDLVVLLTDAYRQRGWILGVAVLRLNFRTAEVLPVIAEYLETLEALTADQDVLRRDDLLFLATIIEELAAEGRLPALSCLQSIDAVRRFQTRFPEGIEGRFDQESLQRFNSSVARTLLRRIEAFEGQELVVHQGTPDVSATLRMRFHQKPTLSLSDFLTRLGKASGLSIMAPPMRLSQRSGSYEEVIKVTLYTVGALQALLFLINGVLIQATEIRARYQVLGKRPLPRKYIQRALEPTYAVPSHLAGMLEGITKLCQRSSWIRQPGLGGLGANNIDIIEVQSGSEGVIDSARPPQSRRKTGSRRQSTR